MILSQLGPMQEKGKVLIVDESDVDGSESKAESAGDQRLRRPVNDLKIS